MLLDITKSILIALIFSLVQAAAYGFVLFILGNYSVVFSLPFVIAYVVSLFSFGLIAELPFLRISLVTVRSWSIGAWIVMASTAALILAAAAYHIYLAVTFGIVVWYLLALAIALALPGIGIILAVVDKSIKQRKRQKLRDASREIENNARSITRGENEPLDATSAEYQQRPGKLVNFPRYATFDHISIASNSDQGTFISTYHRLASVEDFIAEEVAMILYYQIHFHHWQLFFLLAFFTRFDDLISQICAGIVVGIYMQGVTAYGYHSLLEPLYEK